MTVTRKVDGYREDSALPGIRKPEAIDLAKLFTVGALGDLASAARAAGVTVEEFGDGIIHKTVFTFTAASITMTDATTAGNHGTMQLYDFPAGAIHFLGAIVNLTTLAGAGGIADTAALVGALGTAAVATDNATLTGTEADLVPSIAGTLSGGAGTLKGHMTTALSTIFDGTSTAKQAHLNAAVPDAGSTASDTLAVTGTVTIYWMNLGDY